MKKTVLFFAGLFAFSALQAQWVDDPATNTFLANCGNDDGELYMATNPNTGDTYIQWEGFGTNGWSRNGATMASISADMNSRRCRKVSP